MNRALQLQSLANEAPTTTPPLPDGHVHIWFLPLDGQHGVEPRYGDLPLSEAEGDHARQLEDPHARTIFITYRAALRSVLAYYTGIPAKNLDFATTETGKPYLPAHPSLAFNVSHTRHTALIAIAAETPVGIDIENLDIQQHHLDLAEKHFSDGECDWLRSLPENARARAFLRLWCAREATAKALGFASADQLRSLTVDLARQQAYARTPHDSADRPPRRLLLHEVHLNPAAVAYLAYAATHPLTISHHDFDRIP